jgi:hypothetical protein
MLVREFEDYAAAQAHALKLVKNLSDTMGTRDHVMVLYTPESGHPARQVLLTRRRGQFEPRTTPYASVAYPPRPSRTHHDFPPPNALGDYRVVVLRVGHEVDSQSFDRFGEANRHAQYIAPRYDSGVLILVIEEGRGPVVGFRAQGHSRRPSMMDASTMATAMEALQRRERESRPHW